MLAGKNAFIQFISKAETIWEWKQLTFYFMKNVTKLKKAKILVQLVNNGLFSFSKREDVESVWNKV